MSIRFNGLYLDDVVECQGDLCSYGVSKGYNIESILEVYMNSEIKHKMDKGCAVYLTMLGEELWDLLDKSKMVKSSGNEDGFMAEWLGCFYALLQWKSGMYSKDVIKRYPVSKIKIRYNVLHDLDLSLAVDKVLRSSL